MDKTVWINALTGNNRKSKIRNRKLLVVIAPLIFSILAAPLLADDFTREGELEEPMAQAVVDFGEEPADGTVDRGDRGDLLNGFRPSVNAHATLA